MPSAAEVCAWLRSVSVRPIAKCRPVSVTIGGKEFVGAFYSTKEVYLATERAVTEGRVKAGEKSVEYKFYLIGDKPKQRRAHHCYQWASRCKLDERVYRHTDEWYVCCHSSNDPKSQKPWKMFMLCEWRAHSYGYYENHKIDTLERYTYLRVPMSVTYLDKK